MLYSTMRTLQERRAASKSVRTSSRTGISTTSVAASEDSPSGDAAASALLLVSYVMWQVFSCEYDYDSDDTCDRNDLVDASYPLSLFLS